VGAELVPLVLPTVDALLLSEVSPAELLSRVNRALDGSVPKDRFITAAAFDLDLGAGTMVAACAGHVPTLLRNARGDVRAVGAASGPPLGMVGDASYEDEKHDLGAGDVAVFMTDGLYEALETDLLAMETLRGILAAAPAGNGAVHRFLLAQLDRSTARSSADDVLLLSLEVLGGANDGEPDRREGAV
jgi:serine phosphatase RsbU (regulator of sigma subunit)